MSIRMDIYIYTRFQKHCNLKSIYTYIYIHCPVVRTDGRTDVRMDGRTDVRTDGHVTTTSLPKFFGLIDYQISSAMELR